MGSKDRYQVWYHPDCALTPYWVCKDFNHERQLIACCRFEKQALMIANALNGKELDDYSCDGNH